MNLPRICAYAGLVSLGGLFATLTHDDIKVYLITTPMWFILAAVFDIRRNNGR